MSSLLIPKDRKELERLNQISREIDSILKNQEKLGSAIVEFVASELDDTFDLGERELVFIESHISGWLVRNPTVANSNTKTLTDSIESETDSIRRDREDLARKRDALKRKSAELTIKKAKEKLKQ